MSEYKIKIHSHNPEVAEKLTNATIGGKGLLAMIQDAIQGVQSNMMHSSFMPSESPFFMLKKSDFDPEDKLVQSFFDNSGLSEAMELVKKSNNESLVRFQKISSDLSTLRKKVISNALRNSYRALMSTIEHDDEVVKIERIASSSPKKSTGAWQIESIESIDEALRYANINETKSLDFARELVLSGNKNHIKSASKLVKTLFEKLNTTNKRVAYTSLSTQDNEPYLLCPKSTMNGYKSPIPMEVSKCRENCIDSRVSKDGVVSCAYEEWLKTAFEPQNKLLARLDVTRHADNEENLLNLALDEKAKKLKDGEFGYEFRLEHYDKGTNVNRNKQDYSNSIETQLSNNNPTSWGHQQVEKSKRKKQAQTESKTVIEDQLESSRKNSDGLTALEKLLRKLNNVDSDHESTREELLANDGLQAHRGEMAESYASQLNEEFNESPVNYRDELNKDKPEASESISYKLNKSASNMMSKEELLEATRKQEDGTKSMEDRLIERHVKKFAEENIEALLSEEDDWGHQFSDEDLKHFASELGLDHLLEDDRKPLQWEK